MVSKSSLVVLLLCSTLCRIVQTSLHSRFKHFEELKPNRFISRVKRDTNTGRIASKTLSFSALSTHFTLFLTPGSPVLHDDFQAKMVHANGETTPLPVDKENFYTGYLNGNLKHAVDAVFLKDVWLAQIYAPDAVYAIEPLRHHDPEGSSQSVIIFRRQDVKEDNVTDAHSFCKELRFGEHGKIQRGNLSKIQSEEDEPTLLTKRNVFHSTGNHLKRLKAKDRIPRSHEKVDPKADTCDIYAIADYYALKGVGANSPSKMSSLLVHVYQAVDRIFRETNFHSHTSYGFVLKAMAVHTNFSESTGHYNSRKNTEALLVLKDMSRHEEFRKFCLSHLTTQRKFDNRILGLAAIASASSFDWADGICGTRNNGLTTITSNGETPLPISTYMMIVAHELAHNWGSKHDSDSHPECSPSAEEGGKYIMWESTGAGRGPNSKKFSPCTRTSIGNVLRLKAHRCFVPQLRKGSCGDGIVDEAEDCDVGFIKKDACCMDNCRFRSNASCSPINYPCCTEDCRIAPATQRCHRSISHCYMPSYCSGNRFDMCPPPKPRPNDYPCLGGGRCHYGKCVSFCSLLGMKSKPPKQFEPCTCESNRTAMCRHCCRDMFNGTECRIMGGEFENGYPCLYGVCEKGVCIDVESDLSIGSVKIQGLKSVRKIPALGSSATNDINMHLFFFVLLFETAF